MSRKVIYEVGISLDGYIARPDGTFDFLKPDPEHDFNAFFKTVDVALMGRKTYEVMKTLGMNGYPRMQNYVFTHTLPAGERDGIVFTAKNPAKLVRELKLKKGKNIYLCGGSDLARELLHARLVDEISLGIIPVLIGEGVPVFLPPYPELKLKRTVCKPYKSGMVLLTYSVKNN